MSKILKPVIEEVKYESGSLDTLQETLKISFRDENKILLFEYPTIYIVNDKNSDGYSVYVGETTDIVRRTNQHLGEIREDWTKFSKSNTTKMFVIGHHHFNKSLTLDIENRLMLYLLSVDNVSNVQNRRGNPQNKYYTSDELDEYNYMKSLVIPMLSKSGAKAMDYHDIKEKLEFLTTKKAGHLPR